MIPFDCNFISEVHQLLPLINKIILRTFVLHDLVPHARDQ